MQMPWHKKAVAQLIFLTALMLGQSGNVWAEEEVEPESFLSTDEPRFYEVCRERRLRPRG